MAKVKIKLTGNLDGAKIFVNDVQGYMRERTARFRLKAGERYLLEIPVRAPGGTNWSYALEPEPGHSIVPGTLNKTPQQKTLPPPGMDVVSRYFKVKED